MVPLTVSASCHGGQLGESMAGVRLHPVGSVIAGFLLTPAGPLCRDGCGLSEACLQLLCCQSFCCSGLKTLTAAICSKGSWGRKQKKKRMLAQECLSCVSVHETTWEGDRKRSESPKMFDLYLAAPLSNGELTF